MNLQQAYPSTGEEFMSLSEALDDISEEKFVRAPVRGFPLAQESRQLALDVLETSGVFEIHASVPGVSPEQIDITVLGDSVRIAGERTTAQSAYVTEESDYRWLVRERHVGRFDRSVSLPSRIAPDLATADFVDGVLVITLPKIEQTAAFAIPVRAGGIDRPVAPELINLESSRPQ